jgi:hypothetical protein
MLKRILLSSGLVLAVTLLLGAPVQAQTCGTPTVTTLLAGQHIPTGIVTVYNDANYIYVQYTVTTPWVLAEAHVALASTVAGIPQTKKGNPIPGRFPYSATFDPELSTYTFVIPRSGLADGQQVVVAAHAVVQAPREFGGSQTGWGQGPTFPGANWAMYIAYQVQPCAGGPPD